METLVSILAIIGLISVVNHILGRGEDCYLCRAFNLKKEDMKQAGEKATQQMKENVSQASESVSQKIKEKVKKAADNVSQKMSVENKKQGTRYGSNPIRY
jgi:hypothetical protein